MAGLSKDILLGLAMADEAWHVSLFMPTYPYGADIEQGPIRLQNLLREAEATLVSRGVRTPEAKEYLAPAERLLSQHVFWQYQEAGLALFLSADDFRYYSVAWPLEELVVVGDHYHIRPLLPMLSDNNRFYVLALSHNAVRLLEGTQASVTELELTNAPASLAEALRYDELEKERQFHTVPAGGSRGTQIFHGQGMYSDTVKKELFRFFRDIDTGLHARLRNERAPLILAGVEYLLPIYREANTYPRLLETGVTGNPEDLSDEELRSRAWTLVQPQFNQAQEAAAAQYRQLAGTGLAAYRVEDIVPAAYQGRVSRLFVTNGPLEWGTYDAETDRAYRHATAEPGDEDLVNLVAVQTLLKDGTIYAVKPEDMPDNSSVAAIFRY